MDNINNILELFKQKPYLVRMGAKKISSRFNYPVEDIKKARSLFWQNKEKNHSEHKIKILIFDIETSPLKAYVWRRWKQNIYLEQTISEWFMISWAAKWLGEDEIMSDILTPEEILQEDDKRITRSIWQLLNQADIIIAHNGKRFDTPKLNSRFILNGLPPTSPYKQIDTKEVASKSFGFSSNKLDALARYFGIEHKDDTDFELWVKCLKGEKEALDYMKKYNIQDVYILEKVYFRLRSWIKNHPNVAVYAESEGHVCPYCGSQNLVDTPEHPYYTQVNKYDTMRCLDCGGIARKRITSYPKEKRKNLVTSI